MLTLALCLALCNAPVARFFPGYQRMPNPKPDDCIIVPLENEKWSPDHDPILRA